MTNKNKLLNFNIGDEILKISEIFISFYGDQYREHILNSLDKMIFIVYNNPFNVMNYLEKNNINSEEYKNKSKIIESNRLKDRLSAYSINEIYIELIEKEKIGFNESVLTNNVVGMIPNVVDDKLITTIYFPTLGVNHENLDCVLTHELLHIIEEHIVENNEDRIVLQGGFEKWVIKGIEQANNRDFEFLNELVHQKISQEITDLMHSKGIYIFNDEEESIKSKHNYDTDNCIVIDEFYNNFKDSLLRCKLIGNIEEFEDLVGKQELKDLAKWCVEFFNLYKTPEERKKLNDSHNQEYIDKLNQGLSIVMSMIKN